MEVAVVIPYGGKDEWRERALAHVGAFYQYEFPDWRVIVSGDDGERFSRARACNAGVADTRAEVVVINDADTLCPPASVREAVRLATEAPGLVRAYSRYRRLTQDATAELATYKEALAAPDEAIYWQQEPAFAHGCAVLQRDCYETVGGYDPRFEGWGYEDMAAELLFDAFWPDRRIQGDLFHLWHPNAETPEDRERNERLYYQEYEPKRGDREALLAMRFG